MRTLLTIFLFLSLGARAQVCCVLYTSATPGKDSITVQFDSLPANEESASYVKHMVGMMHQSPARTCTGGNSNTIVVTAVPANWAASGGNTQFPNDGITNGTAWNWLTKIQRECAFQSSSNPYTSGQWQFFVSGLHSSSTYTIEITASVNATTDNNKLGSDYRILGISLYGPETLYAQNPAGTPNVSGKTSTFTACAPDGSGNLYFYVNAATGAGLATISGFRLREN